MGFDLIHENILPFKCSVNSIIWPGAWDNIVFITGTRWDLESHRNSFAESYGLKTFNIKCQIQHKRVYIMLLQPEILVCQQKRKEGLGGEVSCPYSLNPTLNGAFLPYSANYQWLLEGKEKHRSTLSVLSI